MHCSSTSLIPLFSSWYILHFYQSTRWWSMKPAPSDLQRRKYSDLEMKSKCEIKEFPVLRYQSNIYTLYIYIYFLLNSLLLTEKHYFIKEQCFHKETCLLEATHTSQLPPPPPTPPLLLCYMVQPRMKIIQKSKYLLFNCMQLTAKPSYGLSQWIENVKCVLVILQCQCNSLQGHDGKRLRATALTSVYTVRKLH